MGFEYSTFRQLKSNTMNEKEQRLQIATQIFCTIISASVKTDEENSNEDELSDTIIGWSFGLADKLISYNKHNPIQP